MTLGNIFELQDDSPKSNIFKLLDGDFPHQKFIQSPCDRSTLRNATLLIQANQCAICRNSSKLGFPRNGIPEPVPADSWR
jgi:hypothetical protein